MRGRGQGQQRGRGRGQPRGGMGARGGVGGHRRGRSRGRARGRRGVGRGRGYAQSPQAVNVNNCEMENDGQEHTDPLDIDKVEDLKKFFIGTVHFDEHFDAQEKNRDRYLAGMSVMERSGVEISSNAKVRALAAAWARHDSRMVKFLLSKKEDFGLVEVLKSVTLLDSSRRIRVEEKKLKRLQLQTQGKIKPRVLGKFKSNIDNLTASKPKVGSVSGALCKQIKNWVGSFSSEELEFYALHFPTEPWKKLADICHLNPKKDFAALPWFLPFCFGEPAPDGSMVAQCRDITAETANERLMEFAIPYSHIKQFSANLSVDSKAKIAATDKLDQVIWWYEDLQCDEVDQEIERRLESGETPQLMYGKLMERLLTFKMIKQQAGSHDRARFLNLLIPIAQQRMSEINFHLEAPVVVIGDRSSSMEVAIRTSTIIASLLTAICSAKLVFFDDRNMDAPFIPSNIKQVLEMAITLRTGGCTAPAASLWPFYSNKEVVRTFIIVTDEGENQSCEGYRFAPLFKKYREEVFPAHLVFVSFLHRQTDKGQMVQDLASHGVTENIFQFKFDQYRPDLTKLDSMFGLLSTDSESFGQEVSDAEVKFAADALDCHIENLHVKNAA